MFYQDQLNGTQNVEQRPRNPSECETERNVFWIEPQILSISQILGVPPPQKKAREKEAEVIRSMEGRSRGCSPSSYPILARFPVKRRPDPCLCTHLVCGAGWWGERKKSSLTFQQQHSNEDAPSPLG